MINFTIDNKAISVLKGTTVYHAAKQHGIDIPIFCYQDRMPAFGACRVCLVEVDKNAKLQTSCTLEATEGMNVKTQSQIAIEGRKGVIELLLVNHPLDCPICDRGGECPLQDQTFKHGTSVSRFIEEKRHFKKPIPLGSVLMLDRERCIVCARCTRFGEIIAGDNALEFKERGFKTEVGTPNNEPVNSKFIGNTIDICPVGALTSQVYRFRARPWDNTPTKTTCTLCPVGCSEMIDSRDGEIMRTRASENTHVNDMWMCDKGWFGYEYTYHPERLTTPLIKENGTFKPVSWDVAIRLIAKKMQEAIPSGQIAAFGGNPLTVEENYMFQKLMREGALVNHVDHRIGMPIFSEAEEGLPAGMEISIGECEHLSYLVLLGCDLTEEFPVIWLRVKQAINRGATVIYFGHYEPETAKHLSKIILHHPGKERETLAQYLPKMSELAKDTKTAVFVGSQYLNTPYRKEILSSLLDFRKKTPHCSLNILEGRGNSIGARFAGMHPNAGAILGLSAIEVMEKAANHTWDYLHVAGCNPAVKFPETVWNRARDHLKFLVVQDLFMTETAKCADVILPTYCYVEKEGHFINIAHRIENVRPAKELPDGMYSDGDIFKLIAKQLNVDISLDKSISATLQRGHLSKKHLDEVNLHSKPFQAEHPSLSLTATFVHTLFDEGVRMKHNPHLKQLIKNPFFRIHPIEGLKRNIKNNETIEVSINDAKIQGRVWLDANVAVNTLIIPLGFPSLRVQNLSINLMNGIDCEVRGI